MSEEELESGIEEPLDPPLENIARYRQAKLCILNDVHVVIHTRNKIGGSKYLSE